MDEETVDNKLYDPFSSVDFDFLEETGFNTSNILVERGKAFGMKYVGQPHSCHSCRFMEISMIRTQDGRKWECSLHKEIVFGYGWLFDDELNAKSAQGEVGSMDVAKMLICDDWAEYKSLIECEEEE